MVETYTDALRRRDRFPAILARLEGKQYVRPDGNHRFAADVRNERPNIPVLPLLSVCAKGPMVPTTLHAPPKIVICRNVVSAC